VQMRSKAKCTVIIIIQIIVMRVNEIEKAIR